MEICSKTVTRNGGAAETTIFTYDEYNKLTTVQHPGGVTETLTYNANGQLTQSTKTNGGGGATETTRYYWNDQGFLTKVLLHTGEPVEYKYDGVGRLKGRKDADGEQIFVQSGWNIMTEQDTEGRRTYYTGSSSQTNNGGEANFFLFNHRGDTVLITDQTGTITNNLHYEAYGKATDNTGTPIPANSISTSTELSYMRFRWYSIPSNRFISIDKLLKINRYSYASGNPVSRIDPFGLDDFLYVQIADLPPNADIYDSRIYENTNYFLEFAVIYEKKIEDPNQFINNIKDHKERESYKGNPKLYYYIETKNGLPFRVNQHENCRAQALLPMELVEFAGINTFERREGQVYLETDHAKKITDYYYDKISSNSQISTSTIDNWMLGDLYSAEGFLHMSSYAGNLEGYPAFFDVDGNDPMVYAALPIYEIVGWGSTFMHFRPKKNKEIVILPVHRSKTKLKIGPAFRMKVSDICDIRSTRKH